MPPFWKTTPLVQLNEEQWESLCDGCAQCCLEKLQDEETGELQTVGVACSFLDLECCRCELYAERLTRNPRCLVMPRHPEEILQIPWLPETCAYLRLARGQELPPWHPLISSDLSAVHDEGVSVKGKVVSGKHINPEDLRL